MGRYGVVEHEGISAWLIYHDQNLRIKQIGWNNPSDKPTKVWIWEDGALVAETTLDPASSGEQNVAGNYQLEEVVDPEFGSFLTLPEGITYRIQWPG